MREGPTHPDPPGGVDGRDQRKGPDQWRGGGGGGCDPADPDRGGTVGPSLPLSSRGVRGFRPRWIRCRPIWIALERLRFGAGCPENVFKRRRRRRRRTYRGGSQLARYLPDPRQGAVVRLILVRGIPPGPQPLPIPRVQIFLERADDQVLHRRSRFHAVLCLQGGHWRRSTGNKGKPPSTVDLPTRPTDPGSGSADGTGPR